MPVELALARPAGGRGVPSWWVPWGVAAAGALRRRDRQVESGAASVAGLSCDIRPEPRQGVVRKSCAHGVLKRRATARRPRPPLESSSLDCERAPAERERQQRSRCFCSELALTGTRATCQVATDLRACRVGTAEEAARHGLDVQRCAVAVCHAHVGTMAIERDQLFGAFSQAGMIVTGDAHIGGEQGKTARSAGEALGDDGQAQSLLLTTLAAATSSDQLSSGLTHG